MFPDTTFAFGFPLTTREMTRPAGRLVDTVLYLRLDRGGAVVDTIALVEAPEREYFETGPMRGLEEDILGDGLRSVVAGDELVLTRGREVWHYPRSGSLTCVRGGLGATHPDLRYGAGRTRSTYG